MAEERGSATGTPVLSEWLGYWVFITYTSGPNLDQSEPTKLVKGQPEAITASFFLENYGPLGIEVRRTTETPTIFMSWGAVLYIQDHRRRLGSRSTRKYRSEREEKPDPHQSPARGAAQATAHASAARLS